jgi:hypothetical protein
VRRLICHGEFLEPVAGSTFFEADYEAKILAQKDTLFGGWYAADFKCPVLVRGSTHGHRKPDLALIHHDFREWWVIEVEIATHDLHGHVLEQVEAFTFGEYGADHASYLADRLPELDRGRLRTLVTSVQPGVLVIVNEDVEGWKEVLGARGGRLCVVQPHRDKFGHYGYLVSGFLPAASFSLVSTCRRAGWSPRVIEISNPAALPLPHGAQVAIRAATGTCEWKHVLTGDSSYLMPVGPGDPLPVSVRDFELHRDEDGQLSITVRKQSSIRRRR